MYRVSAQGVRYEQSRGAERLDLQRPAGLPRQAEAHAPRAEGEKRPYHNRKRQHEGDETAPRLPDAPAPSDVEVAEWHENDGEDLRRRTHTERSEPDPVPGVDEGSEAADAEHRRPEVESLQRERPERERRDGGQCR